MSGSLKANNFLALLKCWSKLNIIQNNLLGFQSLSHTALAAEEVFSNLSLRRISYYSRYRLSIACLTKYEFKTTKTGKVLKTSCQDPRLKVNGLHCKAL